MLFLYPAAALLFLCLFYMLSVIVKVGSGAVQTSARALSKAVKARAEKKEEESTLAWDAHAKCLLHLVVHTYPDEGRECEWVLMDHDELQDLKRYPFLEGHNWISVARQFGKDYESAKMNLMGKLALHIHNAAFCKPGVNIAH